jgi:hypothetical protein
MMVGRSGSLRAWGNAGWSIVVGRGSNAENARFGPEGMTVRIRSRKCSPEGNAFFGQIVSAEISWGIGQAAKHGNCGWQIVRE